jgi:cysteinyl-tRNA synthetase
LDVLSLQQVEPGGKAPKELTLIEEVIRSARGKVQVALNDDLNSPVALAAIAELAKAANDLCDLTVKKRKDKVLQSAAKTLAEAGAKALRESAEVLGLLVTPASTYGVRTRERRLRLRGLQASSIEQGIASRTEARAQKDFARADSIRAELLSQGVEIADTPDGTVWRVGV